jgi:SAM-dependent methyltransferase
MDWSTFTHNHISAPNASTGFAGALFEMIRIYASTGPLRMLLLSEPPEVIPVFKEWWPDADITVTGYSGLLQEHYEFDLNVFTPSAEKYDVVFSQATLEHVCRPSVAIENMVERCAPGGIVVIHTHGPLCPLHRHPVDCVRFFPDFYAELARYLPAELVAQFDNGSASFATFRRE